MTTSRTSRTAGALAHLLLIVVLALGVFVMHTVGHPEGSSGATTATAPAAGAGAGAGAHEDSGTTASRHTTGAVAPHGAHDADKTPSHHPGMAMDMTTLCVAVLGALVLTGLLRAALRRRTDWLVRLRAGAMAVLRPNPPPHRPPDLAQLSVLRI